MINSSLRYLIKKLFIVRDLLATKYHRALFASFGKNSWVHGEVTIYYPENLFIGSNTTINNHVIFDARNKIKVGNNVHISYGSIITTGGLDLSRKNFLQNHEGKPIVISDKVWIGAGAIILPGITIGEGSVIASGAVVTKNVLSHTIVAGSPAKIIRKLES